MSAKEWIEEAKKRLEDLLPGSSFEGDLGAVKKSSLALLLSKGIEEMEKLLETANGQADEIDRVHDWSKGIEAENQKLKERVEELEDGLRINKEIAVASIKSPQGKTLRDEIALSLIPHLSPLNFANDDDWAKTIYQCADAAMEAREK